MGIKTEIEKIRKGLPPDPNEGDVIFVSDWNIKNKQKEDIFLFVLVAEKKLELMAERYMKIKA